jgi:hypothetical protein
MKESEQGKWTWDKQFELQREDSSYWRHTATKLRRAAELVWAGSEAAWKQLQADPLGYLEKNAWGPDIHLYEQYFLLMGFALENALKGILVAQGRSAEEAIKGSHKLTGLVATCGIELSEDELRLLDNVEVFAVWKGRYQTPRKLEDWKLEFDKNGLPSMPGPLTSHHTHRDATEALFWKLFSLGEKARWKK